MLRKKNLFILSLGIMLGVFIGTCSNVFADLDKPESLNHEGETIPFEELRTFTEIFGRIKRDYVEPVSDKKLLEDAVRGTTVKIRVPTYVACKTCDGSGAKKGSSPITCTTCGGVGQVRMQQGFFSIQQTCPQCHGNGKMIKDPCGDCHGQGRVQEHKTLSAKVPAGVDTGDRIRLGGEGEAGEHGGPAGDLYIHINVKEHPIFVREDEHLYCDVPVSFITAALGGELEVPTLSGRVKLRIPPETQTGKMFRLRGKGVKPVRSNVTGDLLCRVTIETPVNLTSKQKELLREFDDSLNGGSGKHSPQHKSWLDKVKGFFDDIAG